ncbi:MAG: hypothetical protein IJ112_00685 [Oscillospiraceae bacterium]|nr:hypothetical protein [Oscillospiraceae bacterium]
MSMDYEVYLKDASAFSRDALERYAASLGFQLEVHPEYELLTDDGFVPFCLTDRRFSQTDGCERFVTGFEAYPAPWQPVEKCAPQPKGVLGKLFQKKPEAESPFQQKIKDSSHVISLHCSGADPFESLVAELLGAFCVKYCGAILDDPQLGRYYDEAEDLEVVLEQITIDLLAEAEAGELRLHRFEGWI